MTIVIAGSLTFNALQRPVNNKLSGPASSGQGKKPPKLPFICRLFGGKISVRMEGLEPPRLSAPDPKSGAATNYATSAKKSGAKIFKKFYKAECKPKIIFWFSGSISKCGL